ncbi:MAG: hypothetical protein V1857_01555 [archaeon]
MNSDQKYGALLFVAGLAAALFYVAIFMGRYVGAAFLETFVWWAIALPVILAVLAVLTIVAWIGWTMLTTPPLEMEAQQDTA